MSSILYHSPSEGEVSLDGVLRRILDFRAAAPDAHYRVIVGTDSLAGNHGHAFLVTAIVAHRVGNGGIYFWRRVQRDHLYTLRDRMIAEALQSLEVAQLLQHDDRLQSLSHHELEVHVDIGHDGPTRQMIAEIVGMVTAFGFTVRTKPDSYAASKVADRHTIPFFVPVPAVVH